MQHTQHACVCGQNCLNFATGSFSNFGRKPAPKQAYSNMVGMVVMVVMVVMVGMVVMAGMVVCTSCML